MIETKFKQTKIGRIPEEREIVEKEVMRK